MCTAQQCHSDSDNPELLVNDAAPAAQPQWDAVPARKLTAGVRHFEEHPISGHSTLTLYRGTLPREAVV